MKSSWFKCAFLLIIIFSGYCVASTEKDLKALEASFGGKLGVYAINTANNHRVEYRAAERFPFQSTFKLIAVSAMLKKSMTDNSLLQEKIDYTKKDLTFWSPITEKNVGSGSMTIAELCAAAMMYSDNAATNLLVKKLMGPSTVNGFAHSINNDPFHLVGWEPDLNSDPSKILDTSTPKAMGMSLQKLTLGKVLASSQREQLVNWMKGNTTGDTRIRAGVPQKWVVADKTGAGDSFGISNDIAVIWPPNCAPIVLAIYSVHDKKDTFRSDDVIVSATRMVMKEFAKTDSCLQSSYS